MSAFPSGVPIVNSLHDRRNELRTEVAVLKSVVNQLSNWVEQLEQDRVALVGTVYLDDAAFDAAWYSMANSLLSAVQAETNLGTTSFRYRMKNALALQGLNFTHYQTSDSNTWAVTHNLGYDPEIKVYTWDVTQTVLSEVTPLSVVYPTPNVSITIILPTVSQGIVKFS